MTLWWQRFRGMIAAIMERRLPLLAVLLLSGAPLWAHTVPTIEVEAEFTRERSVTLHVNVDARLFLAAQPTALPPVPASWWFDQSETERAKTMEQTRAYVAKTLSFTVGGKKFEPIWNVVAIDSATVMPLAPGSAEAHLLCEYQGKIPDAPGGFQLRVAESCAVGVILLNSMEGDDQRAPQALFPGEDSRKFPLPERVGEKGREKLGATAESKGAASTPLWVWSIPAAVLLLACFGWRALKKLRGPQPEAGKVS
jgi:hypothetical protein